MARTARKFHVGSLELVCLTDGTTDLFPPEAMFPNVPMEELKANGVINEDGKIIVGFNSLVVRSHGKLILVDTGWGDKPSKPFPGGGELWDNFRANGINPEEIDVVINTHGHPDHIGWNTRVVDGQIVPTFPRAKYYITKGDWDYYTDEEKLAAVPDWTQHTLDSLRALADSGQMELADGETPITPEVRMMPSPGHTVGHASVLLSSGNETAFFLGDIMHHPAQFNHPEWTNGFDILPELGRESREKLFRAAYEQQALVLQVHNAWPSVAGRLLDQDGKMVYKSE